MADLKPLTDAIVAGDREAAASETRNAIAAGEDPRAMLAAMVAAMAEVGERFKRKEVYVPEMLIAARAFKTALPLLEPLLVAAGIQPEHKVVIGTVQGDLHDIGKNLVALLWRGAHFEVVDLGVNVPAEKFVDAIREHGAAAVGLSALLTTTMVGMAEIIRSIRAAGHEKVKILVGGASVTKEWAAGIGADAWAADAASAVDALRRALAS
jgi:5-methyltetrahydrofolate--homocysteine methyltransferase